MPSQKKKIFVSYSSKDKPFVDQFVKDITKYGAEVWEYSNGIKVGESIPTKIGEELSKADYYVIILSPNSVASTWVERELSSAIEIENNRDGAVFIFPVLHRECKRPVLISAKRYADFAKNYQLGLKELLNAFGMSYIAINTSDQLKEQRLLDFISRMDALVEQSSQIIKQRIPLLIESLSVSLSNNLADNIIKSVIIEWRENNIEKLKDIKTEIQRKINDWIVSEEARRIIDKIAFNWLNESSREITTLIKAVYIDFNLNPSGSWLSTDLDVPIDQTLSAENLQIEFDDSFILGTIITLIETALIMVLMPDFLLMIIYLTIGSIVSVILTFFGQKTETNKKLTRKMEEWASDKVIPKFLRKYLLSDEKLSKTLEASRIKIRNDLNNNLNQSVSPEVQKQTLEFIREFITIQKDKIGTTLK